MTTKAKVLGWMPSALPGVMALLVYVAWFVAFFQLGRRPVPSMDDPKFIGGVSTMVSSSASALIVALFLGWAASSLLTLVVCLLPPTERRAWWWRKLALGVMAMAVLLAATRYSPGGAVMWFLD